MTVFFLGLTVLLAVRHLVRGESRGSGTVWVLPLGLLVVGQIWMQRERLEGYQLRVLGQRFRIETEESRPGPAVSGDRGQSDIFVAGAGAEPVAYLSAEANGSLAVTSGEGTQSVVLVRGSSGLRTDWQLLRSVPLADGDRIQILTESTVAVEWTFLRSRETALERLHLAGTRDRLVSDASIEIVVPYPQGSGVLGLFPSRPGIFQRTYPLADVFSGAAAHLTADGGGDVAATSTGGAARVTGLKSFLYYEDGEARLAVLDAAVVVMSDGGARSPTRSIGLGAGPGPMSSFSVAGLPYRDFPDPRLAPTERYGIRPLRSFRPRLDADWITLSGPRPEIVSIPVAEWEGPVHRTTPTGDPTLPVRLVSGAGGPAESGVRLSGLSDRFDAASQAVLRLPESPTKGTFELLAPAGIATWETGQPFTLGDGDRGLLLRVDGLTASGPFLALLAALFALAALPFGVLRVQSRVKALALVALGFASLRALLSLSAMSRFPFVDEGHHISLWLIPALPWFVCTVGSVLGGEEKDAADPVAVVERGFSGGYMGAVGEGSPTFWHQWLTRLSGFQASPVISAVFFGAVLVFLAAVLFSSSPSKSVALGILTTALGTAFVVRSRLVEWASGAFRALSRLGEVGWPGALIGSSLFLVRIAFELVGFREQISIAGTRIGLSVVYTPVTVLAFALVLWVHVERVNRGSHAEARKSAAAAWADLGLFLVAAFVGVSLWISDFGIALTTLLGPLVALALVGWSWGRRLGPGAALGGALPIILFATLQISPGLVHPGLAGDAEQANRLDEWSRNELLLLERGDPDLLKLIGESRSEALAVMRETMRSYTRGNWAGRGFLAGRVSPEISNTAVREHAAGGLLASQWGAVGTLGLVLMLLAMVAPFIPDLPRRVRSEVGRTTTVWWAGLAAFPLAAAMIPAPANLVVVVALTLVAGSGALLPLLPGRASPFGRRLWPSASGDAEWAVYRPASAGWLVGASAAATLATAGIYMVLANYGLVLFTGKNIYLLGLDSLGDTLEGMALLILAAGGLATSERAREVLSPSEESELPAWQSDEQRRIGWRRVG